MEVRYEDLVPTVHGTMAAIWQFASLRPNSNYLSVLPRIMRNIDKWRVDLSAPKVALLENTIGSKSREPGYEVTV